MRYLLFVIAIFGLFACKKDDEAPQPLNVFTGRAYYQNSFAQDTSSKPLSMKELFVKLPSSTNEQFFQKVITDQEGFFYITTAEDEVVVFSRLSLPAANGNELQYYGFATINKGKPSNNRLVLKLDEEKQNGFVLRFVDAIGNSLAGATVHLYNNIVLAQQNNPVGAVKTYTTDAFGKVSDFNLPKGSYYINSKLAVDTVLFTRQLKPLTIAEAGIAPADTVIMLRRFPQVANGFTITVKDTLGGNISGAQVYLYTSQVLAASNDPSAAIESFISDNTGKVKKRNLPAGNYFLNATKTVLDTITYQRLVKPILIPASGIVTDTMVVKRR